MVNRVTVSAEALAELGEPTAEEQAMLERRRRFEQHGSGYRVQQSTRPQTVGFGLADSPAGQLAWIAEKVFVDLRYYHAVAKGGHFAALEQPAIFTEEVRAAFRAIEKR